MRKQSDFIHDQDGYNKLFSPSDRVTVVPFINSPVRDVLVKLTKWRVSAHRVVLSQPKGMPSEINCKAIGKTMISNDWFLRSFLQAVITMEQSYNETTGTGSLKLVGYGITGLTAPAVNLNEWRVGQKKPRIYSSTIGDELNEYLHLFTAPSTGRSDNGRRKQANHVAMNKVDKWIDGDTFSPTVSVVANYIINAGLRAIVENTQLKAKDVEKSILAPTSALDLQGAIATVALHGLSRWQNPLNWSSKLNSVQVKARGNNQLSRGLIITNHGLDNHTAIYVNKVISDLPTALTFSVQKALRTIEWDGSV